MHWDCVKFYDTVVPAVLARELKAQNYGPVKTARTMSVHGAPKLLKLKKCVVTVPYGGLALFAPFSDTLEGFHIGGMRDIEYLHTTEDCCFTSLTSLDFSGLDQLLVGSLNTFIKRTLLFQYPLLLLVIRVLLYCVVLVSDGYSV